jgi:hypothetical protein
MRATVHWKALLRFLPYLAAMFLVTWWANRDLWGPLPEALVTYWWMMPLWLALILAQDAWEAYRSLPPFRPADPDAERELPHLPDRPALRS